jgi:hypothetical protein
LEVHPHVERSPRPSSGGPPTVYLIYFALLTRIPSGLFVRLLEEEKEPVCLKSHVGENHAAVSARSGAAQKGCG